jgi:hypothetical protein
MNPLPASAKCRYLLLIHFFALNFYPFTLDKFYRFNFHFPLTFLLSSFLFAIFIFLFHIFHLN